MQKMSIIDFLNQNQGVTNAFLVLALVLTTGYYAKKVSNQTNLMLQKEKRRIILEEIHSIVAPHIVKLKKEIEVIQNHELYWSRDYYGKGIFLNIFKILDFDFKDSLVYCDFFEKNPEFEEKYLHQDDIYDELNELYCQLEGEIRTPKLKERLDEVVEEFNKSRPESKNLRREDVDEPEKIFGNFIISGCEQKKESYMRGPTEDFWKEYREELLKFRDTPKVKQLDGEIEKILKDYENLKKELLESLGEILDEYRKEYHITEFEIYSSVEDPGKLLRGLY